MKLFFEELFCEIILNLDQWFRRRCHLKNLVEEKQRELIPPGLQSWPLQLIEHLPSSLPSPPVVSESYNMGSK